MSGELIETVRNNPNIKEVYFDANGNHYLNIHKGEDQFYGQFSNGFPILSSKITLVSKRENILGLRSKEEAQDQKEEVKEDHDKSKFKKTKK